MLGTNGRYPLHAKEAWPQKSYMKYLKQGHGVFDTDYGHPVKKRNLKIWADVADKICLGVVLPWRYLKSWEWKAIFGHAV